MFVEVVRLRAKGDRLDKGALSKAAPVRGHLNVHQRFDHWARRDVYVATVTRGDFASTDQLLPALDQVRIGRLTGNHFVLLGLEDVSYRKVSAVYAQSWWCRVIADRAPTPSQFDDGDLRRPEAHARQSSIDADRSSAEDFGSAS